MQVGNRDRLPADQPPRRPAPCRASDFLNVGVILESNADRSRRMGRSLMDIKPVGLDGAHQRGDADRRRSERTNCETKVLLADGEALVIGGLIREIDNDNQTKIPWLGDLWLVGWFFQRREVTRERSEIIVAILPASFPTCLAAGISIRWEPSVPALHCCTVRYCQWTARSWNRRCPATPSDPETAGPDPAPNMPEAAWEYAVPEPVPAVPTPARSKPTLSVRHAMPGPSETWGMLSRVRACATVCRRNHQPFGSSHDGGKPCELQPSRPRGHSHYGTAWNGGGLHNVVTSPVPNRGTPETEERRQIAFQIRGKTLLGEEIRNIHGR